MLKSRNLNVIDPIPVNVVGGFPFNGPTPQGCKWQCFSCALASERHLTASAATLVAQRPRTLAAAQRCSHFALRCRRVWQSGHCQPSLRAAHCCVGA